MVIETGRIRYTRHGYFCRKCGFNFHFDLTSPMSKCPNCGSVINDKLAYYFCRIGRGIGAGFVLSVPIILLELVYLPKTFPLISIPVIVVLSFFFAYMQMWTLILARMTLRASLIVIVAMVIFELARWVLGTLNIMALDNGLTVLAGLITGIVLSAVSLAIVKVKSNTFDYVPASQ
jgi:hypothetical protein